MTTRNEKLMLPNNLIGSFILGSTNMFQSVGLAEDAVVNELQYPTDLFNFLQGTGLLSNHRLHLKPGFLIMLLRILQPKMAISMKHDMFKYQ